MPLRDTGARSSVGNLFAGSLAELRHPPKGQISFLDGLRTCAILLVVSGHFSADFANRFGSTPYSRLPFVMNGWIGVDLFFVLSGFFIGGQLWKELRRDHDIAIGRFMLRRGFRIWPLYYFIYLCVLVFALAHGHSAAAAHYGWTDLIFITNYHSRGFVEGSWSLCTEEQFYIITPLAMYFFARRSQNIERCRPWLWLLLALVPTLRAALWILHTGHFFGSNPALFSTLYYMSITHCDGLIMGLIVANLWETRVPAHTLWDNPGRLVAASVLLLGGLYALQKEVFDFSALAIFFGALVWFGLNRRLAIFQGRFFFWMSRLSFGMYLNHEYLAPWLLRHLPASPNSASSRLAWNLAGLGILVSLSAALALVTFCLVEHPFLQLRKIALGTAAGTPATRDLTPVARWRVRREP